MTDFRDTDGTDGPIEIKRLRLDENGALLYPDDWTFEDAVWAVYVLQNRIDSLRDEEVTNATSTDD